MSKVKIITSTAKINLDDAGNIVVLSEMTREQIKESIRSMLGVLTDRGWADIVEELTPGLWIELAQEKLTKEGY